MTQIKFILSMIALGVLGCADKYVADTYYTVLVLMSAFLVGVYFAQVILDFIREY